MRRSRLPFWGDPRGTPHESCPQDTFGRLQGCIFVGHGPFKACEGAEPGFRPLGLGAGPGSGVRLGLLRGRDPERRKPRIGWYGGPVAVCGEDWLSPRGPAAGIGPCVGTAEN